LTCTLIFVWALARQGSGNIVCSVSKSTCHGQTEGTFVEPCGIKKIRWFANIVSGKGERILFPHAPNFILFHPHSGRMDYVLRRQREGVVRAPEVPV